MSAAPHLFFTYATARRFRAAERAPADLRVTLRDGRHPVRARCVEVSATGAVFALAEEAPRGALLGVELELPERVISALGRRVGSRPGSLALAFVKMDDADRLSLAELVDSQAAGGSAFEARGVTPQVDEEQSG